jgi:hypothetical protein
MIEPNRSSWLTIKTNHCCHRLPLLVCCGSKTGFPLFLILQLCQKSSGDRILLIGWEFLDLSDRLLEQFSHNSIGKNRNADDFLILIDVSKYLQCLSYRV